jgi:hypothetical protein
MGKELVEHSFWKSAEESEKEGFNFSRFLRKSEKSEADDPPLQELERELNAEKQMHFARAHTMARLEIGEDSIQLEFLNAGSLKAKIDEKNVDTPCVPVDGALLLTGTTEEVQEFLFSEENDDKGFDDALKLEKAKVEEVGR